MENCNVDVSAKSLAYLLNLNLVTLAVNLHERASVGIERREFGALVVIVVRGVVFTLDRDMSAFIGYLKITKQHPRSLTQGARHPTGHRG